jgi:aspartyl-tRNA(Asn)/glutamyl-tRNA(Gln) amidotransferase subunit A
MDNPPTLLEASAAVAHGKLTPLQLTADCLSRIGRYEPQVSAWVHVDTAGAMHAAQILTRELAAGTSRGPLHGIPLAIKDVVDVAGMPTRAGSSLTVARPVTADAPVVARLRAAGAVILGKTVTTEFACFDPPPTKNPWNLAHTPGGSSSGSAAALALGMCLGAIGSQTGGSITRPASYCGVSGCKPSFGRVSRRGVVPVTFHLDHVGPLARTAADCAGLLSVMAGDDPDDPANSPRVVEDFSAALEARVSHPPRLGVIRPFFFDRADADVVTLTEAALAILVAGGAQVIDVPLPAGFDTVHAMHRRIMACEAADYHRRQYGAPCPGYSPKLAALLDEGFATSMADYQEALRHQAAFAHAVERATLGVDALVTPSTPTAAPGGETTGDPLFNSPWSHAGVPTVSIPCALTAAGLPLSLQLIGPQWSEAPLLATAVWCERLLNFRCAPPMLAE